MSDPGHEGLLFNCEGLFLLLSHVLTFGQNTTSCVAVVPIIRMLDLIPYSNVIWSPKARFKVNPTALSTTTLYSDMPIRRESFSAAIFTWKQRIEIKELIGPGWEKTCEFVTFPLVSWVRCVRDCIDSWSLHPYLLCFMWTLKTLTNLHIRPVWSSPGRWCIDKLGVFHANQITMCLHPHLN